jgi:hypothetical protein
MSTKTRTTREDLYKVKEKAELVNGEIREFLVRAVLAFPSQMDYPLRGVVKDVPGFHALKTRVSIYAALGTETIAEYVGGNPCGCCGAGDLS